jgi:hypothetical protein
LLLVNYLSALVFSALAVLAAVLSVRTDLAVSQDAGAASVRWLLVSPSALVLSALAELAAAALAVSADLAVDPGC